MSQGQDPQTVALAEERLSVTKEARATGRVRVSTRTETLENLVPVDLAETQVDVTRVPVEREIDVMPEIVTEGDLTIIPVVEERVVITRQLYLREEIHVRRTERRETAEIPVSVRRQTAMVERIGPEDHPQDLDVNQKEDHHDL